MYVLGIDDAGRGPVIGPMILAGVLLDKEQEEKLKKEGIRDSKIVSPHERVKLEKVIKENCLGYEILKIEPMKIDEFVLGGKNLNTLEAMEMAQVVNRIFSRFGREKFKVVIDCPSVNINSWKKKLLEFIDNNDLEIACEHKADANHISVSAASILAKCLREEEVEKLKKKYASYGDMGSGYPSDPATKKFLKDNGLELKDSGIFRKSWATWKEAFKENNQADLSRF